jgi:hypothetical protein
MSDTEALRRIIEIAAAALAEEGSEDETEGMESEGSEVESDDNEASPERVRATALRIRNMREG